MLFSLNISIQMFAFFNLNKKSDLENQYLIFFSLYSSLFNFQSDHYEKTAGVI